MLCSSFIITCDAEAFLLKQIWGDRENRIGGALEVIYSNVDKDFMVNYINSTDTYYIKVKFDCDDINSNSIKALLKPGIIEVI